VKWLFRFTPSFSACRINKVLKNMKHFKVKVAATQVERLHRGATGNRRQGIASTYEKT